MVQIQNNFTEMFLMMPLYQNSLTAWPPELIIKISLNDISIATGQYIIFSWMKIQMSDPGLSC